MSAQNIANLNAKSITVLAAGLVALPTQGNFLLIDSASTVRNYLVSGSSAIAASSTQGFVGAGKTQIMRIHPTDTHVFVSGANVDLAIQVVEGV